jgi:hypothetical protein
MGAQREQKGRRLLDWIMAHPDQVLTVEAMAKAVNWSPSSASSTAARFVGQYPEHFMRTSKGAYRWASSGVAPDAPAVEAQPVKDLFLRVIKHASDGRMLAEDVEDSEAIYIVQPHDPFGT